VPGVTAALSCAADLKISLTKRHAQSDQSARSVGFLTFSHADYEQDQVDVPNTDSLVVYMMGRDYEKLFSCLTRQFLPQTPVALVAGAGTNYSQQFVAKLSDFFPIKTELRLWIEQIDEQKLAVSLLVGKCLIK